MVIASHISRYSLALAAVVLLCGGMSPNAHAQVAAAAAATHADIPPVAVMSSAERLNLAGIHNVGKVSDVLFRGAQPSQQGFAELKKLGVTTVVDLRGNSGPVAWERGQVESLGMRFVNIPVGGMSNPTDAQVAQFLKLFRNDPQQKVFVHCYYGEDRTGVMVAAYRIAQQNWTADRAIGEMNSFGFHSRWHPGMRTYVQRFPTNFAAQSAFAEFRTASVTH
jgi:tyrosine-protein phosphatase SIW14